MGEKYLIKIIRRKQWFKAPSWFWLAIDVSDVVNRPVFVSMGSYPTERQCVIQSHKIAELIGANVMLP